MMSGNYNSKRTESIRFLNTMAVVLCCLGLYLGCAGAQERAAAQPPADTEVRIRFIGTGHPDIFAERPRMQAGIVVDVGDERWLLDAGAGVLARLYDNGVPPPTLNHIFISHLHYDHCLDLDAILLLWQSERWLDSSKPQKTLTLWGPDGLEKMLSDLYDVAYGADGRGRGLLTTPFLKRMRNRDATVYEENGCKASFLEVKHACNMDCWAIKLETPKGTIVYSGDLGSQALPIVYSRDFKGLTFPKAEDNIEFSNWARGADTLILDGLHLAPEELAKVAGVIRPKTLVLFHLPERPVHVSPSYDLRKTIDLCAKAAERVIVAEDGLEMKL